MNNFCTTKIKSKLCLFFVFLYCFAQFNEPFLMLFKKRLFNLESFHLKLSQNSAYFSTLFNALGAKLNKPFEIYGFFRVLFFVSKKMKKNGQKNCHLLKIMKKKHARLTKSFPLILTAVLITGFPFLFF